MNKAPSYVEIQLGQIQMTLYNMLAENKDVDLRKYLPRIKDND